MALLVGNHHDGLNEELRRMCQVTVSVMAYFKVLSQHFAGGTEEKHGKQGIATIAEDLIRSLPIMVQHC
jgi:hypothetical protein